MRNIRKIFSFILMLMFLVLSVSSVFAGSKTLTFQWDYPIPPTDLAGFYFYKADVAGGPYTKVSTIPFIIGQVQYVSPQNLTVPDNTEVIMYFVVSAYDTSGNESTKSNEVNYKFDFVAPANPINFIIKIVTVP